MQNSMVLGMSSGKSKAAVTKEASGKARRERTGIKRRFAAPACRG